MANEQRTDLISRKALSEKIGNMKFEITNNRGGYKYCNEDEKNEWDKLNSFDSLVCDAPTVDAVEVVHGRWLSVGDSLFPGTQEKCSLCGFRKGVGYVYHYCPNCGARMDEQ